MNARTGRCHARGRALKADRDDVVTLISRDGTDRDRASHDDGRGRGRWSCDAKMTTMTMMMTRKTLNRMTSASRDRCRCDGHRDCHAMMTSMTMTTTKCSSTTKMRQVQDRCAIDIRDKCKKTQASTQDTGTRYTRMIHTVQGKLYSVSCYRVVYRPDRRLSDVDASS